MTHCMSATHAKSASKVAGKKINTSERVKEKNLWKKRKVVGASFERNNWHDVTKTTFPLQL